ncbi:MAG: exonuclease SbcCD subunit D [Clostridia bacterium]|nr:exonuclease SbcCD subunit D [Clostridia bacterium]
MKFIHTSDLHLGLRLCEMRMNEDIAHLLREIADIAVRENCSAVVIAGDIYDRSNPTPESVALFDSFVTDLAARGVSVLSVYGNHDSPERVAYLSRLLSENGVHFSPLYDGTLYETSFDDAYGTVRFHLLPFLRPSVLRLTCPDFTGTTAADTVRFALKGISLSDGDRHVCIAHQFAAGAKEPSDEAVGGTELVPYTLFEAFDYTALGHLHSPHAVGKEHIRYSGSPLKCSFSEAADEKSVTLVELKEKGNISFRPVPLHPLRDLREMHGSYEDMTSFSMRSSGNTEDYLRIVLTDDEDIPDVMAKLRTVYPNLLRLSYDNKRTREMRQIDTDRLTDPDDGALSPAAVFAELYELQHNEEADDALMKEVMRLFDECTKEDSHATA